MELKTYFITGASGFIGRNLCKHLLLHKNVVLGADNFENSSYEDVAELSSNKDFYFEKADITYELDLLHDFTSKADVVIHLASTVGVTNATNHPNMMLSRNIVGAINVVDTCQEHGKRLMLASSSEVYGWNDEPVFSEYSKLNVPPPRLTRFSYALSKIVEEYYSYGSGVGLQIMRFFNTTGPGQNNRNGLVLPNMISQGLAGEPITVYGDGTQTRCFCHIDEVVEAIRLLSGATCNRGDTYNIGGNTPTSMLDLAYMVQEATGNKSEVINVPYNQIYGPGFMDMQSRVPSLQKIYDKIQWEATTKVHKIIGEMVRHEMKKIQ